MLNMLQTCYGSDLRVAELIDYGDASSIQERLMPTDFTHCFERPQEGVCVFYHRDRGERWTNCEPSCLTKAEVLNNYHAYIWEDGKWTAYKNGRINHNVKNLY
jgi:hypothetical protein